MIGIFGFLVIWGAAAWFKIPSVMRLASFAIWWGLVAVLTYLGSSLGGDLRLWLLLGPVMALVLAYRFGLRKLRSKAQPKVDEKPKPMFESAEVARYSRHLLLREIGGQGQQRLKNAKVLVVGAGGLGAPVLMYLAASGVGHITVVDDDEVEASNLQRQIIHRQDQLGADKVASAMAAMKAINPYVSVTPVKARLNADNAAKLIEGQDLVLDGTDNFDTRYLVNRVCFQHDVPLIAAAITQWEGQLSLYHPTKGGPCYECIFPTRPAAGMVPACSEAGVAAPLPGVMGSLMAIEAVKYLTQAGEGLQGRLMLYDGLYGQTRMVKAKRRETCACCGQIA